MATRDDRLVALDRALAHETGSPTAETLVKTAKVFEEYLSGEEKGEGEAVPKSTDEFPGRPEIKNSGKWLPGDLVLSYYPRGTAYVFRKEYDGLWRIYGPGSSRTWTGTDKDIEDRLAGTSEFSGSATTRIAIQQGKGEH